MKRIFLWCLSLMPVIVSGQSLLPEPMPEAPSNSGFYYKNQGQFIDHLASIRNDVLYYTERTYPSIALMQDKVSFWDMLPGDTSLTAPDTLRRIDMKFICDKDAGNRGNVAMPLPCATVKSYEVSQDYLNYYLPHCGTGITDVRGYARVVYENVFPEIDVHLYSNAYGPKIFFVVKPGGNPANIHLQFEGQDSITALTSTLSMYLGSWEMSFPNAYAYEINNTSNAATVLSWLPTWNHSGGGNVTIFTGSYNSANTLVIAVGGSGGGTPLAQENLDWSIYYGDAGEQKDGKIDADSRSVYHGMTQYEISFPETPGQQEQPASAGIAYMGNWCISRFTNTVRNWCTYYGGSSVDKLTALKVYKGVDGEISRSGDLWAAGVTTSDDVIDVTVPVSFFKQGYDAGGTNTNTFRGDGLIAAFDKTSGYLKYNTYFGSEKTESIQDLAIDHEKGDVYIVGSLLFLPGFSMPGFNNSCAAQVSGQFPLCSGNGYYFKNVLNTDRNDAFIAQLSIKGGIHLKWSTLFGGDKEDEITYAEVHKGKLYIGGITQSQNMDQYPSPALTHNLNKFPLANYPGSFFQNKCNSVSAFISCFNEDKHLVWSTLLGTALGVRGIDVNSKGDLYVLLSQVVEGHYEPSSPAANASGKVPTFNNGLGYYETSVWNRAGAALLKFDPSFRLSWATKLHAYPAGAYYFFQPQNRNSGLVIDEADQVFVYTSLDPMANPTFTVQLNGAYWQSINAASATGSYDESKTDNFIYAFNSSDQLQWATFFGSLGSTGAFDQGQGIVNQGDFIYVTGMTNCNNSPYDHCLGNLIPGSYCDQTYNAGMDNYISRFNKKLLPLSMGVNRKNVITLSAYPNPGKGLFTISFTNDAALLSGKVLQVRVSDITGRVMAQTQYTVRPGYNAFNVDLGALASGTYLLTLTNDQVKSSVKLVKE